MMRAFWPSFHFASRKASDFKSGKRFEENFVCVMVRIDDKANRRINFNYCIEFTSSMS
jgi:hypothetical protein